VVYEKLASWEKASGTIVLTYYSTTSGRGNLLEAIVPKLKEALQLKLINQLVQ